MMLPSVSFGVIPMGTDRRGHRPRESFDITDSDLVTIEMLSGFLSLTHPDEIGAYVTAWEHLFSIAQLWQDGVPHARQTRSGPGRLAVALLRG